MSQPPPADDNEDAARRPPTRPEPPVEPSDESDRTQRVEMPADTEPDRTQRVEIPTTAEPTHRVDLPTHTAGSAAEPATARTDDTAKQADETRAEAGDTAAGAAGTPSGPRQAQPVWPPAERAAPEQREVPGVPERRESPERREPQWPADDSTDTPPTGMRALPRPRPWEDMETPPQGIPVQRAPMAPVQGPQPPGRRDRLWVHLLWEGVLALGVIASALLLAGTDADVFSSEASMRSLAMQAAIIGLLASGLALSLRVAAPNLAVGAIALMCGIGLLWLINERDVELGAAVPLMLLAGAGIGLALAVVIVGLHVPAWAATLGAAFVLQGTSTAIFGNNNVPVLRSNVGESVADQGWLWFAVFAVFSVTGGALWAIPGIRYRLAGTRSDRDPAIRPGAAAGFGAALGLIGSSVLAAGGGILFVLTMRVPAGSPAVLTIIALGAVLLGGVSAFGRRGGVFGTLLAVVMLELLREALVEREDGAFWRLSVLVGAAVLVGLAVTRLLELTGRRNGTA